MAGIADIRTYIRMYVCMYVCSYNHTYGTPHKKFTFCTLPIRSTIRILTYFVVTMVLANLTLYVFTYMRMHLLKYALVMPR